MCQIGDMLKKAWAWIKMEAPRVESEVKDEVIKVEEVAAKVEAKAEEAVAAVKAKTSRKKKTDA